VWSFVRFGLYVRGLVIDVAGYIETRQGSGFPDWVIVSGDARLFPWYGDTVTELEFDHEGRTVRIVVRDRDRLVIRARGLVNDSGYVNLRTVPGLVRRFYGSDCFGHTDYYVATR